MFIVGLGVSVVELQPGARELRTSGQPTPCDAGSAAYWPIGKVASSLSLSIPSLRPMATARRPSVSGNRWTIMSEDGRAAWKNQRLGLQREGLWRRVEALWKPQNSLVPDSNSDGARKKVALGFYTHVL